MEPENHVNSENKGIELCRKCKSIINKKIFVNKKMNFYSFFFFGIIPIIITVIMFVKTIIVYKSIEIINSQEMESFIAESNWIDIGLSIISIAVSVWLGINIANLIDRKQIENLNARMEDLDNKIEKSETWLRDEERNILNLDDKIENKEKKLETKISSINIDIENRFYKTRFIEELMKTKDLYESAFYLYDIFYNNNEVDYQELYQIESEYLRCITAYETTNWTETYSHAIKGLSLINELKKKEKKQEYFFVRKGDFLFYKNIALTHNNTLGEFSNKELEESISLYKKIINLVDDDSKKSQKFIGYLYNTIGYTYDILHVLSKDEDDKKRYSNLSINNMSIAVQYNNKGRYYRNLGLAYQHEGNLEKAKECYKIAFEKNPKDYKAYNNRLAIVLRELDVKFDINNRFDNNVLLSELKGVDSQDKCILLKELKEVLKYQEFAEKSNCWFEDIQYNTCKMYMYLYVFSNYRKTKYIELAIEYGERALFLNGKSNGGKFCLRNAYECWNKLEKAKTINDELLANKIGDSKKANEFYNKRMKKDSKDSV